MLMRRLLAVILPLAAVALIAVIVAGCGGSSSGHDQRRSAYGATRAAPKPAVGTVSDPANEARPDPRRRQRPHAVPLREGQGRHEQLRRGVRQRLAPAHERGKAKAGPGVTAAKLGMTKRTRRQDRGHLRGAPALHLRRRPEARRRPGAGPRPVRRRVVRAGARAATRSTTTDGPHDVLTMPSHVLAHWSRYLGALALLGVGLDHLEQYSVDSYSVIPTIGTLFALNFASAALLAARPRRARPATARPRRAPRRRRCSASPASASPPARSPACCSASAPGCSASWRPATGPRSCCRSDSRRRPSRSSPSTSPSAARTGRELKPVRAPPSPNTPDNHTPARPRNPSDPPRRDPPPGTAPAQARGDARRALRTPLRAGRRRRRPRRRPPLEPRVPAVGVPLPHARHAPADVDDDHDPVDERPARRGVTGPRTVSGCLSTGGDSVTGHGPGPRRTIRDVSRARFNSFPGRRPAGAVPSPSCPPAPTPATSSPRRLPTRCWRR